MLSSPRRQAQPAYPLLKPPGMQAMNTLEQIAQLAGTRPAGWEKPAYGSFDYWLACNCGWLGQDEIAADKAQHDERRNRALRTSHRFKWEEEPRHAEPKDTGDYAPEMSMKLIKDRNLTDSARRIAIFVMRHAYQDNRKGRFVGMTVSFMMKGLKLSRRTVQRSLTLLETRGYLHCEVAKGDKTRMCIGLIVHLLQPLFPGHHKQKWPERGGKPEASPLPLKHRIQISIREAKHKISRHYWAVKCADGVFREFMKTNPLFETPQVQTM